MGNKKSRGEPPSDSTSPAENGPTIGAAPVMATPSQKNVAGEKSPRAYDTATSSTAKSSTSKIEVTAPTRPSPPVSLSPRASQSPRASPSPPASSSTPTGASQPFARATTGVPPGVSTLIRVEFWDIGSFAPYEAAETDAILHAFASGQDTLTIGSIYEVRDLQKLITGEANQINLQTQRIRPIRVSPPYRYDKNVFSSIKILQHEFEMQDNNAWKRLYAAANSEISNAMESKPILQKTYISLGRKRTYAVVFSGSTNDAIHLVNEHNPQEAHIPVRKARARNHLASQASSSGLNGAHAQSSFTAGSHSFRRQQTTDDFRTGLAAKIEAAPPPPPLETTMTFTVGDGELDSRSTALLRSLVPKFPRPDVLTLSGAQVVKGFDKLEQNGASINGKPLIITFADAHAPLGQLVLPKDLELADSVNTDDLMTKIGPSTEDCCICVDVVSQDAVELKQCRHKFHGACLTEWLNTKMTCPMCNIQFGKLIGRQPQIGRMQYYVDTGGIAGSDKDTYIVARFEFPDGQDADGRAYAGRREMAFLHDNAEGRVLLELFKVAFRRRVMFGLGENMTNQTYKPTFNVHIKTTRKDKGMAGHGYPDTDYFARTLDCLNANGVQIEDIYG